MKSHNVREKCGFQQKSEVSSTALTLVTISHESFLPDIAATVLLGHNLLLDKALLPFIEEGFCSLALIRSL
jgi:hypothetical protein